MPISLRVTALIFVFMTLAAGVARADEAFAEKKVVLQISDAIPEKQTLVLNVANNLLTHYGQDKVDVEVVALGPGLKLLFADNANKARIKSLAAAGVRFSACQNTLKAMAAQNGGVAPALLPEAQPTPAGIARIVDLEEQGYHNIRP